MPASLRRHRILTAVVAGATVLLGLAPAAHAAHAAGLAGPRLGRAVGLRLPANVGTGTAALRGASCAGAGSCTLAGFYPDLADVQQPMTVTRSGGHWARARELLLPSNATAGIGGAAESVSCSRSGSCVAVGNYETSGHFRGFAATESGGTWRRAVTVRLPPNAMAAADASVGGVACTGPGNCVVAGDYADAHGRTQAMAVTEVGGNWTRPVELRPPANAGSAGGVFVTSIACPAAGFCVAVGRYNDSAGHARAMAVTESAGTWRRATQLILPRDAAGVPLVAVNAVGCSRAGSCVAVGLYRDHLGRFLPVSVAESAGTWARAQHVTRVPANAAAQPSLFLSSVACAAGGPCVAAGNYRLTSGGTGAVVLTRSGTRWVRASQILAPPDGATGANQDAQAAAIGCAPSGFCAAAGTYLTAASATRIMAATGS